MTVQFKDRVVVLASTLIQWHKVITHQLFTCRPTHEIHAVYSPANIYGVLFDSLARIVWTWR